MGRLTNEHKLTVRTAAEVVERVDLLLATLAREGYKFRGRKIGAEGLVGAIVLDFLDRPEAEKRRLLAAQVPRLEAMIDGKPAPSRPPGPDGDPEHGKKVYPPPAKTRRKSG